MAIIECSLVLTAADFDPSEITRRVGMVPTLSWKTGDLIGRTTLRRTHDGWKLTAQDAASISLEEVLSRLLALLEPQQETLWSLIENLELDVEFACVIHLGTGAVPSMHLDRRTIGSLQAYNAELDIDFYSNRG